MPRLTRTGAVGAIERLKEVRKVLGGDSRAAVTKAKVNALAIRPGPEFDGPAGPVVFDGVGEQVGHDAAQSPGLGDDSHALRDFARQGYLALAGEGGGLV